MAVITLLTYLIYKIDEIKKLFLKMNCVNAESVMNPYIILLYYFYPFKYKI